MRHMQCPPRAADADVKQKTKNPTEGMGKIYQGIEWKLGVVSFHLLADLRVLVSGIQAL